MRPPRFSLIAPGADRASSDALAERAVRSVLAQECPSWELLLPAELVAGSLSIGDARVRTVARAPDGRGGAQQALEVARGELVGWLDTDGWLAPDALSRVDRAIGTREDVDYVYTDEVLHGATDAVVMRKPDWSPERQRGQDCCGQLSLYRRSVALEVGGLREDLGGAARHDLGLRIAERSGHTVHVPVPLYHRAIDATTIDELEAALRPVSAAAVQEHLARSEVVADVERRGASLAMPRRVSSAAPVSIVIPTAGVKRAVWGRERVLVIDAVRSVLDRTEHPDLEVVVVLDPATPPAVRDALDALPVVLIEADGPFSFSARCNDGVAASRGQHVVLLNDDVLVEQPGWLSAMVGYFAEPDVGVVGARLLYADGTLQHAGILLNQHPRHILAGFAGDDPGPFDLLRVAREVSAVTGACMATTRALWDELGGLSPDFPVAFNDVDYCLRAAATGRRTVWTPEATLYHFESQTRQPAASPAEIARLEARWGHVLRDDPYGSPGFEPGQAWWVERQLPGATDLVRRAAARLLRQRQHERQR